MKRSGTPIKEIKEYIDLCTQGDDTLKERLSIFEQRKKIVQQQIEELTSLMDIVEHKIWYYQTAIEAGSESVHEGLCYSVEG